jgi:hypothetical protein
MASIASILGLISIAEPLIANLIVFIKGQAGQPMTAVVYLDQADAQFAANMQQIGDWMAAHGKVAATGSTATTTGQFATHPATPAAPASPPPA